MVLFYWLVGGGLPQKAPPSVTVTETTKRLLFPHISLTGGLLYLTPKMRTLSSMGVMFHWPCLWKKHWSHNEWLQYCVSSWLIFLFFLHSSILIVVFDPNYWSGSDQNHLILHSLGCHAHRTTPFLFMFSKEIRYHGTRFRCGPSHVPHMCICSHYRLYLKVAKSVSYA